MRIDKRKFYGTIFGSLAFILVILAFTYARYVWKSGESNLSFNISDEYFYCESGKTDTISNLVPTLDYRTNSSSETFQVNNIGKTETTFSVSLNITSIDDSLKSESLKYKLMVDKSGGSNICTDASVTDCESVVEGNFKDFKVGMNTLAETIELPSNVRYQFYLFIYIDGNMENDEAMQKSSMSFTLEVCEVVVFFDYNGGTGTLEFLKVTDSYTGLPTPTHDDIVISYDSDGGSSISNQTINYTFDNWYLDESYDSKYKVVEGAKLETVAETAGIEGGITTNHTLHANWNPEESSGTSNDGCITLPSPTKTGYTFNGWYSDSAKSTKVGDAGDSYCIKAEDSSHTLYAKWTPISYTIAYNLDGGTQGSKAPTTATYDTALEISNPTKTGYDFGGWTSNTSAGLNTATSQTGTTNNPTTAWTGSATTNTWFKNLRATTGTVTLTANWDKIITATFYYYNGASATANCTLKGSNTSCDVTIPTTSRTTTPSGYTLRGWSTSDTANATTSVSSSATTVTISNDISYYASYEKEVTVTFRYSSLATSNYTYSGHEGKTTTATATKYMDYEGNVENSQVTVPTAVTGSNGGAAAENYIGVSKDINSATVLEEEDITTENTTYYAVYTENLTFYYYNGSSHTSKTVTRRLLYNATTYYTASLSETEPTASAYDGASFSHWSYNSSYSSDDYKREPLSTGVNSLYAVYKKTLTLSYDANEGSNAPSSQTGTKYCISKSGGINTINASLTVSSTEPTRSGYTFTGWNTASDGSGTTYAKGASITMSANTTLYAMWEVKRVAITLNANNCGTVTSTTPFYVESNDASMYTTESGTTTTTPALTVKTGYTFLGWYTATTAGSKVLTAAGVLTGTAVSEYTSTSAWAATEAKTLYAQCTPKTYTVSYNANGGTGTMSSQTASHGSAITVSENAFTRTGYTFTNWNTAADGSGTTYATGASITITGDITLYAQWKQQQTEITLNANNCGTISGTNPFYAKYGTANTYTTATGTTAATAPTLTAKTGYQFLGWYTATSGGSKVLTADGALTGTAVSGYTTASAWAATSAKTLYAQCSANSYSLVRVLNNNLVKNGDFETYTTVAAPTGTGNSVTHTWDGELNGVPTDSTKAYNITSWGTGANMGVAVPELGYHAHMRIIDDNAVVRFKTNEDYAGKTQADVDGGVSIKNGTISTNRWLGIAHDMTASDFTAGKTYVLTIDIYRKSGSTKITGGLYYATTDNSSRAFNSGQCSLEPSKTGEWETLSWTFTLSSDYTTTVSPRLYLYGYNGAPGELYIDNVRLEEAVVADKTYDTAYTSTELATSTLTGKTFDGWYNDLNYTTKLTTSNTFNTSTATFDDVKTSGSIAKVFAKWTNNSYKITVKAGNGISTLTASGWTGTGTATISKKFTYGESINLSSLITPAFKTGYSGTSCTKTSGSGTLSGCTLTVGDGEATITINATTLAAPVPSITTSNTTKIYGASATTLTATNTTSYDSGVTVYYKFGYSTSSSGTYTYGSAQTGTTTSVGKTEFYGTRYYKVQAYVTDGTLTSSTATWSSYMSLTLQGTQITLNANDCGTISGTSPFYAKYGTANTYTSRTGTTAATAPTLTAKTGYTFLGWYTAASGGSKVLTATGALTGTAVTNYTSASAWAATADTNLYAQCTTNKVYIKFSVNGGTIESPTPASSGTYTWTTDSDGVITKTTSSETTSILHTISYGGALGSSGLANWNNSSYMNISLTGHTAQSNQWKCMSGNCEKESYDHSTAYNASDFCDASDGDCTVILGVNWTPAIYTITLDNQSATTAGTTKAYYQYNTTKTVDGVLCYYYTDSALTTCLSEGYNIELPTKKGATFGGYFTETNGGGTQYVNASGGFINNIYKTAGNKTLYAKWTNISYTLTVNPNGGTYNGTTSNSTFTQTYDTVKNVGTPTAPSGYKVTFNGNGGTAGSSSLTNTRTFSGWTKSGTGLYVAASNATTSSITRTAKTDSSTGESYENFAFTAADLTSNTWYYFRYPKYTYTDGDTYEIRLQTRVNTLSGTTFTLRHAALSNDYGTSGLVKQNLSTDYSDWTDITLTRTISGTTTTIGSNTSATVAPVFEGYTGNLSGVTADVDFDIKNMIILNKTKDTLLQSNANAFLFREGNGTLTASYTNGSITLPTATRTGYTFKGWNTKSDGSGTTYAAGASYTPTAATTLYAYWVDETAPTPPTYTAFHDNDAKTVYTSGDWANVRVHTTISSTDSGSGVAYMQYSKDKSSWSTFSFGEGALTQSGTTWSGTEGWTVTDGRNDTFYFRACDNAGNCSAASETAFNIKYDTSTNTPTIITMYDLLGSKTSATNQFTVSGSAYTSSGTDPYISFDNTFSGITGVTGGYVQLSSGASAAYQQQIFYETSSTGFNETHSNKATMASGGTKLYVPFTYSDEWAKVRYDFGSTSGVTFNLKHLAVAATSNQWNNDAIILRLNTTEALSGVAYWQYTYSSSASTTGTDSSTTWVTHESSASNTYIPSSYSSARNQYTYIRYCDNAVPSPNCASAQTYIKIDKKAPTTMTLSSNSDSTYSSSKTVTVTLTDTGGSGLVAGSVKYGWSTSTTTAPTSYTTVNTSATSGTNTTTFKASVSGVTGTYYLWVVPVTYKDNAGNSNTTTVKSGAFNIGPRAAITLDENDCGPFTADVNSYANPIYAQYGSKSIYTTSSGTTAATMPTFANDDYHFYGWYTAASGGSKVLTADGSLTGTAVSGYTTSSAWAATSAKTLYAQCVKKIYAVQNSSGTVKDYYTNLASAISAADATTYNNIVLLVDHSESSGTFTKNVTFTTNGNLTLSGGSLIVNSGVTVTKKGSGTINGTSGVTFEVHGNLNIAAGTVASTKTTTIFTYDTSQLTITGGTISNNSSYWAIRNGSSNTSYAVKMTGGTITSTSGAIYTGALEDGTAVTGNVVITGGTISGARDYYIRNDGTADIAISGTTTIGSSSTNYKALNNTSTGTITMTGGSIKCGDAICVENSGTGTMNLHAGTISAASATAVYNSSTGRINLGYEKQSTAGVSYAITVSGTGESASTVYCGNASSGSSALCYVFEGATITSTTGRAVTNYSANFRLYKYAKITCSANTYYACIKNQGTYSSSGTGSGILFLRQGTIQSVAGAIRNEVANINAVSVGSSSDTFFNYTNYKTYSNANSGAIEGTGPVIRASEGYGVQQNATNSSGTYYSWKLYNGIVGGTASEVYGASNKAPTSYRTNYAVSKYTDDTTAYKSAGYKYYHLTAS